MPFFVSNQICSIKATRAIFHPDDDGVWVAHFANNYHGEGAVAQGTGLVKRTHQFLATLPFVELYFDGLDDDQFDDKL